MRSWQRWATVLLLTIVGVEGLDWAVKCAPLPRPASRFLGYYEALGRTESLDRWQRILLSLAFSDEL